MWPATVQHSHDSKEALSTCTHTILQSAGRTVTSCDTQRRLSKLGKRDTHVCIRSTSFTSHIWWETQTQIAPSCCGQFEAYEHRHTHSTCSHKVSRAVQGLSLNACSSCSITDQFRTPGSVLTSTNCAVLHVCNRCGCHIGSMRAHCLPM